MSQRLLVIDFQIPISQLRGAEQFLQSLQNSGVAIVPSTEFAHESMIRAAGIEIVGFAGDSNCNISLASQVAKAGGVIFAFGDGALVSWCKSSSADAPDSVAWLNIRDFGDAMKLRAFQQRIGGS